MKIKNNKAFSLIEVIFSTIIAALVLIASMNLLISTRRETNFTKEHIYARQITKFLTSNFTNKNFDEINDEIFYFDKNMKKVETDQKYKYKASIKVTNTDDRIKEVFIEVEWDNYIMGKKSFRNFSTVYNDKIYSIY
jgi:type II secretory pathway pseudopilin PulG